MEYRDWIFLNERAFIGSERERERAFIGGERERERERRILMND